MRLPSPSRTLVVTALVVATAVTTAPLATAERGVPPVADTLATTPAPPPARADVDDAASGLRLEGRGFGHGRGLSQYGAEGAARRGLSHRRILRFYYPRTKAGRASGTVRVYLSDDISSNVVVLDRSHLGVRRVGGERIALRNRRARQWRITPADGGDRSVVSALVGRRWKVVHRLRGDAELDAGGRAMTLLLPEGRARYRGALRSATPPSSVGRDTVNVVPLEQYLRGVVPLEIPASWSPQAVRAQAVAARTYAAFLRRQPASAHYDLCDTSSCQVYGGADAENPDSDRAIRATARQVRIWRGRPAFTEFSASNGGWTARGSRPYLRSRRDPYDRFRGNPYRRWTTTIPARDLAMAYPRIGRFRSARVLDRDGHGAWNGRVLELRIVGSRGRVTTSGEAFRSTFGLRSTWFRVR